MEFSKCLYGCGPVELQIAWDRVFQGKEKRVWSDTEGQFLSAISQKQSGIVINNVVDAMKNVTQKVKVRFLTENCTTTESECATACSDFDAEALQGNCYDFGFDSDNPACKNFAIDHSIEQLSEYTTAEVKMDTLLNAERTILNILEKRLIQFVDSQNSTAVDPAYSYPPNLIPQSTYYTYNPGILSIENGGANWIFWLGQLAIDYGLGSDYFAIHSSSTIEAMNWRADKTRNSFCCDGREAAKLADIQHFFARRPVAAALGAAKDITYLIANGSIGLFTYRVYKSGSASNPLVIETSDKGSVYGYSYQPKGYPNIWINVEMKKICAQAPDGSTTFYWKGRAWAIPMFVVRPNQCGRNVIAIVPDCNAPLTVDCPPAATIAPAVAGGALRVDCRSGMTAIIGNDTIDLKAQPVVTVTHVVDFLDATGTYLASHTITGLKDTWIPIIDGVGTYNTPTLNIPSIMAQLGVPVTTDAASFVVKRTVTDSNGSTSAETTIGSGSIVCAPCGGMPVEGTVYANC